MVYLAMAAQPTPLLPEEGCPKGGVVGEKKVMG